MSKYEENKGVDFAEQVAESKYAKPYKGVPFAEQVKDKAGRMDNNDAAIKTGIHTHESLFELLYPGGGRNIYQNLQQIFEDPEKLACIRKLFPKEVEEAMKYSFRGFQLSAILKKSKANNTKSIKRLLRKNI